MGHAVAVGENVVLAKPGLVYDLSLEENLLLQTQLGRDKPSRFALRELESLFALCDCPIDWFAMRSQKPDQASPSGRLQAWLGRALLLKPDVLQIREVDWPHSVLAVDVFSKAFYTQFPWRRLAWLGTNTDLSGRPIGA